MSFRNTASYSIHNHQSFENQETIHIIVINGFSLDKKPLITTQKTANHKVKSRLFLLNKHHPSLPHSTNPPNGVLIFGPPIFAEVEKIAYICKRKTILPMNWFLQQSLEYAAQHSYLDDLYHIYPTIPNGIRDVTLLVKPSFSQRQEGIKTANSMTLFLLSEATLAL